MGFSSRRHGFRKSSSSGCLVVADKQWVPEGVNKHSQSVIDLFDFIRGSAKVILHDLPLGEYKRAVYLIDLSKVSHAPGHCNMWLTGRPFRSPLLSTRRPCLLFSPPTWLRKCPHPPRISRIRSSPDWAAKLEIGLLRDNKRSRACKPPKWMHS
jgi:hypothetical protein